MAWRVISVVPQCNKVTHYNYNSDQLEKIFRLVGTPDDPALVALDWRVTCLHA